MRSGADTKRAADPAANAEDGIEDGSGFVPVKPFELVVFGGTGDLARRKLIPSLFHRFVDGQFDASSRIISASRSQHSRESYLKLIKDSYLEFQGKAGFDAGKWSEFVKIIDYVALDVLDDSPQNWSALEAKMTCDQCVRIFYLAMPPRMYAQVCQGLKRVGLATPTSRVVLEKPIGNDFESAQIINNGVGEVFDENRIYRIDHYLGKETVQNLLVLRFGNILFEPLWTRESIDHIQITAAEAIGVSGRGAYYDQSGALRDMVQNHLLQLLCLTAMEPPATLDGDDIRTEKIKVLQALRPITSQSAQSHTVRGQYSEGVVEGVAAPSYLDELKDESGLDGSNTETFVAIKTEIDNWRWAGVPIYLRTGKRMAQRWSEIVVQFKPVPHSVFSTTSPLNANRLVIRLQPGESVNLWVEIKEPGAGGLRVKSWPLDLTYDEAFTMRYPDAYERLLMDVVRGRLSLFMRRDEVEAAWRWVDGIQQAWAVNKQPAHLYPAGTEGPMAAALMVDRDGREWWDGTDK